MCLAVSTKSNPAARARRGSGRKILNHLLNVGAAGGARWRGGNTVHLACAVLQLVRVIKSCVAEAEIGACKSGCRLWCEIRPVCLNLHTDATTFGVYRLDNLVRALAHRCVSPAHLGSPWLELKLRWLR